MAFNFMSEQKKALITGISGMDGSNLSKYLLSLGYKVFGTIRRHSVSEAQDLRICDQKNIETLYADLTDKTSLERILKISKPDEIYNLAAMSHVRVSFDVPNYTLQVNTMGVLRLLDAYKEICPKAKFYQASSSEMFGSSVDSDMYQRETTHMTPVSAYGCSKLAAYHLVRNYRYAYNLFATNGILFNHSGKGRGSNFVEQKIIKTMVLIKHGLANKLELGNLKSSRDVGSSEDFVRAMHLILNYKEPSDWVIATGVTHSIEQFCEIVSQKIGIDYKKYLCYNPIHERAQELPYLRGDATKAKNLLGWEPKVSLDEMIQSMIDGWEEKIKTGCLISL